MAETPGIAGRRPWELVADIDVDEWSELTRLVEWCDQWLDDNVSDHYKRQPLAQDWARVSKVVEEAGEAIDALIGVTGQNPRKGAYGDMGDLEAELCDTALTALYALQHFTKDADYTLLSLLHRARYHRERIERPSDSAPKEATDEA